MIRFTSILLFITTTSLSALAEDQFCNAYDATVYNKSITQVMSTTNQSKRNSMLTDMFLESAVSDLNNITYYGDENGENKGYDQNKPRFTINKKLWWGPIWSYTTNHGEKISPVTVTQSFGDIRRGNSYGVHDFNKLSLREARLDFSRLPESLKIDRFKATSRHYIRNQESGVICQLIKTDERQLDYPSPNTEIPMILSGESRLGDTAFWDSDKKNYSGEYLATQHKYFQTLRFAHKSDPNFGFALECTKQHSDISDVSYRDATVKSFKNFTMQELPDEVLQAMSFRAFDGVHCLDVREASENLPDESNEPIERRYFYKPARKVSN